MGNDSSTTAVVGNLIERLRCGDEAARGELIARSQVRLQVLARKHMRGYPRLRRVNDTMDILQSASVRLMTALKSVKPTDARHYFALASQQIRWTLLTLGDELWPSVDYADQSGPADVSAPTRHGPNRWVEFADLHDALEKLDAELREVVDLYITQELP